jgi:hypothetical protein
MLRLVGAVLEERAAIDTLEGNTAPRTASGKPSAAPAHSDARATTCARSDPGTSARSSCPSAAWLNRPSGCSTRTSSAASTRRTRSNGPDDFDDPDDVGWTLRPVGQDIGHAQVGHQTECGGGQKPPGQAREVRGGSGMLFGTVWTGTVEASIRLAKGTVRSLD